MNIKRYNSAALTSFKKSLIRKKGDSSQKTLLENAKNYENHDFVSWLDEQIVHYGNGITAPIKGDIDAALPDMPKLSASEFINPPESTIHNWFSTWRTLQISDAANSSVWAYITRQMIAEGKLRPYDLMLSAADKGDEFAGKHKIENALAPNVSEEEKSKRMDKCVRNFLRRLCGLYEERGTRSLYQNCPFAKAWWQCHIAESVKSTDKIINADKVVSLFQKKPVWEQLSDKIATRLTVLGDENIRNGIIMFLTENNRDAYHKIPPLRDLLTSVGIMTTWCALGYFPPEQVKMHIAGIAESIEKQPLGESTDPEDKSSKESE